MAVGNELIELFVAADVELAETPEELGEVVHDRIPELCPVQDYADFQAKPPVFRGVRAMVRCA